MGRIFSEQNKFDQWLAVELAAAEALAESGEVPVEAARALRAHAAFEIERIDAIERETRHDVIAFTTAVAEKMAAAGAADASRWLHYGLTSNDVVDTAQALMLKQASKILIEGARELAEILKRRAYEFKNTVQIGRTHGIHAEPITFGLKIALWYDEVARGTTRLEAATPGFRGISEATPIDFHCSYACTKSVADQYVRDYARLHNLPTVVLRMGCIAGPGQFGNQGQGWVAHFVYSVLAGRPVTVYGDGFQVRDVLHVSDLVNAMNTARAYLPVVAGKAFNVGGGVSRSVSVREMISLIEHICHKQVQCSFVPARPGDQLFYISDNTRLFNQTGWLPSRTLEQTIRDISAFWHANRTYVMRAPAPGRSKAIVQAA